MADEWENEYRRGFTNAFANVYEVLGEVENRLMDDNGKLGETTRAVLAFVQKAVSDADNAVQDYWREEDRRSRDVR